MWYCVPVIPALGRLKQKNHEFETSLGYIASYCLKPKRKGGRQRREEKIAAIPDSEGATKMFLPTVHKFIK
jgi:hypothetical protein